MGLLSSSLLKHFFSLNCFYKQNLDKQIKVVILVCLNGKCNRLSGKYNLITGKL